MKMPRGAVRVGDRWVGLGFPCYVIAEAGVNHGGSVAKALELVDAAARAGADAVKFQTFRTEKVIALGAPKAEYQVRTTGRAESQFDMVRKLELDVEAHHRIAERCFAQGIQFLSSPFDEESVELLEALGVPAYKIGSGEITNVPFIRYVAEKRKPVILSTGMSSLEEVRSAVRAIHDQEGASAILLQCVSNYPADPGDANLAAMATMRDRLGVPVGYSDHTVGDEVSLAAVALGACVVEKHLTLDRRLPGPDHAASAEPDELQQLVARIRRVEAAIGDGVKRPAPSEENTALVARRSVHALRDLEVGHRVEEADLQLLRPGSGIPPCDAGRLLGRRVRNPVAAGRMLSWEDVE